MLKGTIVFVDLQKKSVFFFFSLAGFLLEPIEKNMYFDSFPCWGYMGIPDGFISLVGFKVGTICKRCCFPLSEPLGSRVPTSEPPSSLVGLKVGSILKEYVFPLLLVLMRMDFAAGVISSFFPRNRTKICSPLVFRWNHLQQLLF